MKREIKFINQKNCKALMLRCGNGRFQRVSREALEELDIRIENIVKAGIHAHESKGKTIKHI